MLLPHRDAVNVLRVCLMLEGVMLVLRSDRGLGGCERRCGLILDVVVLERSLLGSKSEYNNYDQFTFM